MRFETAKTVAIPLLSRLVKCTLALLLSACAASQTGVASGDRSVFGSVAVIPQINDRLLFAYWPNPFASRQLSEARLGWDAAIGAGQIAQEVLGSTGASVRVTSDPTGATAREAEVAVVLRQTPLNALAQTYDPGRDFLLSATSIAGAAQGGGLAFVIIDNQEDYLPRSVLRVTGTAGPTSPDFCAVGITPYLINPKSGAQLKKGRSLMGIERLPTPPSGPSWSTLGTEERATVLAYCQSALRRVVSQSFVELGVVQ